MKKIFAVSLIAITAVSTAHAQIASQAYVDQQDTAVSNKIGTLSTLTTQAQNNLVAAINEIDAHADTNATAIETLKGDASTAGSVAKSIADAIGTLPGNASTVAQAITASNSTVAGLDYAGAEGDGVVTQVTQADGLVGATKTKITTSHIASDAGIVATQLAQGVQADLALAHTALQSADISDMQVKSDIVSATTGDGYTNNKSSTSKYPSMATAGQIASDAVTAATNATTGTLVQHTAGQAAGSATNPVYIASDGTATASNATVGSASQTIYLNAGTFTAGTTLGTAASANVAESITQNGTGLATAGQVYTAVAGATSAASNALDALDMVAADTTGTGNVVSSVNQVNGKVTAEKNITAVTVPVSNTASEAGTYVLTSTIDDGGNKTYYWEQITRPAAAPAAQPGSV